MVWFCTLRWPTVEELLRPVCLPQCRCFRLNLLPLKPDLSCSGSCLFREDWCTKQRGAAEIQAVHHWNSFAVCYTAVGSCLTVVGFPGHSDLNVTCHCCPLNVVVVVVVDAAAHLVLVDDVAAVVVVVAVVDGVVAESCEDYLKTFRRRCPNPL